MANADIHLYDIGTALIVTLKDQDDAVVDLTAATLKKIILRKPDGTLMEVDAEFVSDGTDGEIQYITQANDLDQLELWSIQGRVTFTHGTWTSSDDTFYVAPNLDGGA